MIVFDNYTFGTQREIDPVNGYLRVSLCNITKAQVRPYLGKEVPDWEMFGLESDKIYGVLCPSEELEKAASTFNNIPLCRKHIKVDVEDVPSKDIVGSLGDNCVFEAPYLKNSLIVYDKKEIDKIMNGTKKELSCGYTYTPVKESGEYEGQHYDFKMTDIVGNHIALVKRGRAGRDVMVSDSSKSLLEVLKDKILAVFDSEIPEEQEEAKEAGDDASQQGETQMAEEVKEEVVVETPVEAEKPAEAPVEAPVEPAPAEEPKAEEVPVVADEKPAEVEDACSDEKKEEKKEEEKEEKPAESKKEDKKEEEPKAEDKCTKDSELVMDIDAIKAQVREEVIAEFKAKDVARKAVRSIVGDVDVMAFDSSEDIYKFACEKAGMNLDEIVSFKSAFCGYSAGHKKLALDAAPISSGEKDECFSGIRVE